MRQDQRTNVPEVNDQHGQFQVQMRDDKWSVFDGRTGGWTGRFETYKEADAKAAQLHAARQAEAAANVQAFFVNRNGNPA
jgi:hypothetical protein